MTENTVIHYTPQAVAKEINVSVQSVRRWADTYQEYLSESSHPAPGKTRLYVWSDVETLKKVRDWRNNGLTPDVITIKLSEDSKGLPVDTITTAIQTVPEAQGTTPGDTMIVSTLDAIQRRLEAVEAVNNEARREASAAARDEIRKTQRDMLVVFMAGAITMGVVILLFVAIVWLYGK